MTDVIDLETWRRKPNVYPMFTVHVYKNSDNEFEVSMEVEDGFDDEEIFEALLATAMKYATDHELGDEYATDRPNPAND